MGIVKCKMCGGDLNLIEGVSTAECKFCGSVQTVPRLDDDKKLLQFERAERLRKQCEFDKAAGIYENIVADFRQEAEAYWGLVLCKYGIEYVDDPATGKKIPTCHRSSFDSILDDPDLELALENADGAARKIYRDEAKALEQIRKGIVAVSANEDPYDIFICYKETDRNGDRTLDSVLAQDVYALLIDKGYRVFFSRITLEDKLGMEYEHYIFAALNSARIMLVFGTDHEYFNAVWVKNEWSRFLKLMTKDKEKSLIPCYKGIDAYDMPKEFARLQAQDLGKVGATQDLLRGIEKLLSKKTVVQEKVVLSESVDPKIIELLEQGNLALEDGDWNKADRFFEEVLNTDAKNAQAYLGKALVQEQCRTIDAFVSTRKEAKRECHEEEVRIPRNQQWEDELVARYTIPGYLEDTTLRGRLFFNRTYLSGVPGWKRNYEKEIAYWEKHQWLPRVEQFAKGALAERLALEKRSLMETLEKQIKDAERKEQAVRDAVTQEYRRHLETVERQIRGAYEDACRQRERDYEHHREIVSRFRQISQLMETEAWLKIHREYRDCSDLLETCQQKIAQLQIQQEQKERKIANLNKRVKSVFLVVELLLVPVMMTLVLNQVQESVNIPFSDRTSMWFAYWIVYFVCSALGIIVAVRALKTKPNEKSGETANKVALVLCGIGFLFFAALAAGTDMSSEERVRAVSWYAIAVANIVVFATVLITQIVKNRIMKEDVETPE